MIETFRHKSLEKLHEHDDRSGIQPDHAEKLERILFALDNAETAQDLDLPGFRLHPLKGKLKGFWAVTVRANWRVIFRFKAGKALDVDLIDYH